MKADDKPEFRKGILVRLTPQERKLVEETAARQRQTVSEFMVEASMTYATALYALRDQFANLLARRMVNRPVGGSCKSCGKGVSWDNSSGFCRGCQRTYGLATLRKRFDREKNEAGSPPREGET